MWRVKLLSNNNQALNTAINGWIYTVQADVNYALRGKINNGQTSYAYTHLQIPNYYELDELERLNHATDRSITCSSDCDIAILGCGPVGMTMALYLKKCNPNLNIIIYEKRLNDVKNAIIPFSRYWLTHLEQSLISPVITSRDLHLIQKISLEGRVGVDIRNLEYMLLRSVKENEIGVANVSEYKYNSEYLIDATGGRFLTQRHGDNKILGSINTGDVRKTLLSTGKLLNDISPNKLKIAQQGNTIFPMYADKRLGFAYLKINYVDQRIKKEFIDFAHSSGDFGIYFWNGQMKDHHNRSLIFITLTGEEYAVLGLHIKKPMYVSEIVQNLLSNQFISTRVSNLIEFVHKHTPLNNSAIAEPPFLWKPYFVQRKDILLNGVKYINIGDSFFNGNPMVGNGLSYHLREINDIFN